KGHSFTTFWDPVTQRIAIPSRELSMSQLSALHAPAFVLGKLVTTQPDSAGAPSVYKHELTFQDPLTNANCLSTSLIEKMGAEYQKLISGAVINSFSVRGQRTDHVTIAWEGFGRKQATDATALPALSSGQSFFKIVKAVFTFGSGAGSDISAEVLSFDLKVTQDAQPWYLPGNASGDEKLLSKVLIGKQAISGSLTAYIASARRDLFLNNTECMLKVVLTGANISGSYDHSVTIEIPNLKIDSESIQEENQTAAYTFTFTEQSVLKVGSEEYFKWTVQTNISGTEILVAA
ncbi:MAG: phage tail tube protein, partial [Acidobacteriota bacterium]